MSLILAVDTAGEGVSLALGDEAKVWRVTRRAHASDTALWPALSALLKKARRTLADVDAIACAVGPGRFTAVRVGVTFADTLARCLAVPVVGLTRFEAAAGLLKEDGVYGLVIESFRGEDYLQRWRRARGKARPEGKPLWVPAGGLEAALAGAARVDAAASAADLLVPARERRKKPQPPLRPLYLKPANYAKPA